MVRIEMADNFEIRRHLWSLSIKRESHISRNKKHEFGKMPRRLMERITKVTDLYWPLRSESFCGYFKRFLSKLLLRFVSNPIVSSRIYKHMSLILRSKSGYKSFPVMIEGER